MKDLTILKLGGSIISFKEKNSISFRQRTIRRLINEIYEAKEVSNFPLVIVHGVGSFGRQPNKQIKDYSKLENNIARVACTHVKWEIARLSSLLLQLLLERDLPAVLFPTGCITQAENGEIKFINTKILVKMLRYGFIPVLQGDDVVDTTCVSSVCSSDQVAAYLGKVLKASKLLYATDVDGVYDKNPKIDKTANLIKEFNSSDFNSTIQNFKAYNPSDSTLEMRGKIEAIFRNGVLPKTTINIFNGMTKGTLKNSLLGKSLGTK